MKPKEYKHITNLIEVLKQDPRADKYTKNYKELEEYLIELNEKRSDSLMSGIISALENYLEK